MGSSTIQFRNSSKNVEIKEQRTENIRDLTKGGCIQVSKGSPVGQSQRDGGSDSESGPALPSL